MIRLIRFQSLNKAKLFDKAVRISTTKIYTTALAITQAQTASVIYSLTFTFRVEQAAILGVIQSAETQHLKTLQRVLLLIVG